MQCRFPQVQCVTITTRTLQQVLGNAVVVDRIDVIKPNAHGCIDPAAMAQGKSAFNISRSRTRTDAHHSHALTCVLVFAYVCSSLLIVV